MSTDMNEPLGRLVPVSLTGNESFHSAKEVLPFTVHNFWQWSMSDLVSNATRGILAEYIVAQACGVETSSPRDEWAAVDLTTPEGFRIEVKSSAYVQSWHQDRLSRIVFKVPKTRKWDSETNKMSDEAMRSADAYVFALLDHKNQLTLNPVDLSQWAFYVMPTYELDSRSQQSITLPSLQTRGAGPCRYSDLKSEVHNAALEHRSANT